MPLDAENNWQIEQVLSGTEIREILEAEFGPLIPPERDDPSQTAVDYQFADGIGRMGFINPVTQPFCGKLQSVADYRRGEDPQLPVLDGRMGRAQATTWRRLGRSNRPNRASAPCSLQIAE